VSGIRKVVKVPMTKSPKARNRRLHMLLRRIRPATTLEDKSEIMFNVDSCRKTGALVQH
jgi:hypothetical protein